MKKEDIFYFSADRFLIRENIKYEEFSAIKDKVEIVSYDAGLMGGIVHFDNLIDVRDYALKNKHQQIIAVCKCSNEKIENKRIEGFEWCGFDLCEVSSAISAITNCGDGFVPAIKYNKLNQYGLIINYNDALKTQIKLKELFPYESHANCDIYAVWRMIL
jgi:hypothetical protein